MACMTRQKGVKFVEKAYFHDGFDGYMALYLAYSKKHKYLLGIENVSDTSYEFCSTKEKALSLFKAWKMSIIEHCKEADDDESDFKPAPMPKKWEFEWPPVSEWATFTKSTL